MKQDSIFNELLAATAKANLPKDPVPTEGQTLQQIQGLTLQQQTDGLTFQQIEDQYGNGSEDEEAGEEEDELDYVNNNGKFEPEVDKNFDYKPICRPTSIS